MTRRILALILGIALVFGLALSVSADNAASAITIYASVTSDGNADISLTARIRIEEAKKESLTFPLPLNAADITLNERGVTFTKTANATWVTLPDTAGFVGEYMAAFHFTVPDVVKLVDRKLVLDLPLLSGFEYPIESMNLTVMLPGMIERLPTFKSIYHQDSIETILNASLSNNIVSGLVTTQLKDRETLSMTMNVPEEMFPGVSTYVREGDPEIVPMILCAVAALVYWLLFLRNLPFIRQHRATPPEGITAGELSNRLTLNGADLTMMVFTWAQLGYLKIQLDDVGRVILYKRMDMGNERSVFEFKTFRQLFARRNVVDATGNTYAKLAYAVSKSVPGKKILSKGKFGSTRVFRLLLCGTSIFGGVCFAMNLVTHPLLQTLCSIALGILGLMTAWLIQEGMQRLHLRYKLPLVFAALAALVWLGVGIWAGKWAMALVCILTQALAGLMAAYGGRRTSLGRQDACGILGLRAYYKTVSKEELLRIQGNDPEYFYNAIPYAMALGVDKAFAKRFGSKKLPLCPYFSCGVDTPMNAEDWNRFLHETAEIMDSRHRRMDLEKYAVVRIR